MQRFTLTPPLLFLIALVLITSWLSLRFSSSTLYKRTLSNIYQPETYAKNIQIFITTKEGETQDQFFTQKLEHYKESSTLFHKPSFKLFLANNPSQANNPWHVVAEYAESDAQKSRIHLWKNVHIYQKGTAVAPETHIYSASFFIYPKEQVAQTTSPVFLEQPQFKIQAQGMYLNLKTNILQLLSNVQCVYIPLSV